MQESLNLNIVESDIAALSEDQVGTSMSKAGKFGKILSQIFQGSSISGQRGWSVGQPAEDEGSARQPAADTDHRLGDVHPVFAGVFNSHG